MFIKTLSEKLSVYRTDRPDEWTMDEFKRDAVKLEAERDEALAKLAAMESQETVYFWKEIGETDWMECHKDWYLKCVDSPEHDTKLLYAKPVPAGKPASAKEKSELIMGFVNQICAAYESGFTPYPHMTLQQLHRVAQHHVKDEFGVDVDDFEKVFGMELFEQCKMISEGWEKPAVAVPEKLTYTADDYPKEERTQMHGYINGFNDCVDAMIATAPSHSQQGADQLDGKYENVCVKCERIFIGAKFDRECDACPDPCQSNEIKGE